MAYTSNCCNLRKVNNRPSTSFEDTLFYPCLYLTTLISTLFLIIAQSVIINLNVVAGQVVIVLTSLDLAFVVIMICKRIIRWYFQKKRKPMRPNKQNLHQTLHDRYRLIPNEKNLKSIQSKAKEYLSITKENIDNEMNIETELFLAGSVGERFSIPISSAWIKTDGVTKDCHALLSDFDFMVSPIIEKVSFVQDSEKYYASQKTFHHGSIAATSAGPVGFRMKYYKTEFPHYNITDQEEHTIAAHKIKENMKKIAQSLDIDSFPGYIPESCCRLCLTFTLHRHINFASVEMEGPSIKYKVGSNLNKIDRFYGDLTYALKCSEWPEISDWGQRKNTRWPKQNKIEQIKSYGCHFVPQSQRKVDDLTHDADNGGLTWRISFSRAEVELSKLIPTNARMCFVGLKIIARDYLFAVCEKLKSVHLKYVLYFTLENHEVDIWSEDNLEFCFKLLLNNVTKSLTNKSCPLFWVSPFNLYEDFDDRDFVRLMKQLENIQKNPSQFIEPFSDEMLLEAEQVLTCTYGTL